MTVFSYNASYEPLSVFLCCGDWSFTLFCFSGDDLQLWRNSGHIIPLTWTNQLHVVDFIVFAPCRSSYSNTKAASNTVISIKLFYIIQAIKTRVLWVKYHLQSHFQADHYLLVLVQAADVVYDFQNLCPRRCYMVSQMAPSPEFCGNLNAYKLNDIH